MASTIHAAATQHWVGKARSLSNARWPKRALGAAQKRDRSSCDLVKMKVVDVMASGQIKERASVLQSKTQKPVRFEISEGTRGSVEKWMEDELMVGSEYLWPGRFHERLHISTRQYARIVRDWVTSIGLEASAFGTHSMRRTKVTQIYKKTGNLRAVQLLLGHTKMDSTVRYLGVELEDALAIAEAIEI